MPRPVATQLKAAALSVVALLLLPSCLARAADCPPDGDEGLLPTFDADDQCGNYDDCTALAQDNQVEAARACTKKIDDCAAAVRESKILSTSPVAGLVVAIAILLSPLALMHRR